MVDVKRKSGPPRKNDGRGSVVREGEHLRIGLGRGLSTIIDVEDWPLVESWTLYCIPPPRYYVFGIKWDKERQASVQAYLHRILLGLQSADRSVVVDHISGDPLDNRRANLRIASVAQNGFNQKPWPVGPRKVSKYKNVRPIFYGPRRINKWQVILNINGKPTRFGTQWGTEIEAAVAANVAMRKYHGRFARLNDVDMG